MSIRYKVWDTKKCEIFSKNMSNNYILHVCANFSYFWNLLFFPIRYDLTCFKDDFFFTPDFVSSKEKTLSLLSTWTNPTIVLSEASCVATWPWTGCFLVKNGSNFLTSLVLLTSCILRLIIHRNKATSLWRVGTKIRKGIFKVKTQ